MEDGQVGTLSYAVRGRVVLGYFGRLCIVLAGFSTVTLAVSLFFRDYRISLWYAAVVAFLALLGIILKRLRVPEDMQVNEALALSVITFAFTALVMTFPMTASGLRFEDAFFESVSAVTTTGLSTLAGVEDKAPAFLFSRAYLQWTGGLGIVVLSVALLMRPGMAARRLMDINWEAEGLVGGTRSLARMALKVYIVLTFAGILVLYLAIGEFFPAVVHTLSAVSTGGFSPYDESIGGFGAWPAQAGVVFISLLGAVSLSLYYQALRKDRWRLVRDVEVRALLFMSAAAACLLALALRFHDGLPWPEAFRHAPLMAFSAQTTAGFSTLDVSGLESSSKAIMMLSMAVGGNVGSTAGGMKVLRVLVLLKVAKIFIVKTSMPAHAVAAPRMEGQRLESDEIERAFLVVVFFILVIVASWIPFLIAGHSPLDALFEVVSATATVGLSTGITGPDLAPFLKGVLCADMLMGRLEVFAVLVVLYPGTWFGRRAGT